MRVLAEGRPTDLLPEFPTLGGRMTRRKSEGYSLRAWREACALDEVR